VGSPVTRSEKAEITIPFMLVGSQRGTIKYLKNQMTDLQKRLDGQSFDFSKGTLLGNGKS